MKIRIAAGPVVGFLAYAPTEMNNYNTTNVEPLILGAAIVVVIVATAVLYVLLRVARRGHSPIVRVLAATISVLVVLSCPGLIDWAVDEFNPASGIRRVIIHPGWAVKVASAMIALFIAALLNLRFASSRR